jgi:hypothetical protein
MTRAHVPCQKSLKPNGCTVSVSHSNQGIAMKNEIAFVSVDELALETVSGGLLDLANHSLNGNTINVLSNVKVDLSVGDVLSNILNIANQVGCALHCGPQGCGG